MATSLNGGGGGGSDTAELAEDLSKPLKEGERILAPTRRPDGTLRKPIRIRAGYVPQDEVAIYKSKGSLWRKEMETSLEVPPGYDPVMEVKQKSKAAKRNERKKEKRHQAALDKGDISDKTDDLPADGSNILKADVESTASKLNGLSLSENAPLFTPTSDATECSTPMDHMQEIDKKIRALKKKIRLTEAQQQKASEKGLKPEQSEKMVKLDGWHNELKLLEEKKAELTSSIPLCENSVR